MILWLTRIYKHVDYHNNIRARTTGFNFSSLSCNSNWNPTPFCFGVQDDHVDLDYHSWQAKQAYLCDKVCRSGGAMSRYCTTTESTSILNTVQSKTAHWESWRIGRTTRYGRTPTWRHGSDETNRPVAPNHPMTTQENEVGVLYRNTGLSQFCRSSQIVQAVIASSYY